MSFQLLYACFALHKIHTLEQFNQLLKTYLFGRWDDNHYLFKLCLPKFSFLLTYLLTYETCIPSDVRRKNCPENTTFFRKISENFHRIFPENFQYFSKIRILPHENFKCIYQFTIMFKMHSLVLCYYFYYKIGFLESVAVLCWCQGHSPPNLAQPPNF